MSKTKFNITFKNAYLKHSGELILAIIHQSILSNPIIIVCNLIHAKIFIL